MRQMSSIRQIVCPSCAAVNRAAENRPVELARCGKCQAALFDGRATEADSHMFDRQTEESDVPVLVDVWAPWCGPCRMMAPAFQAAANELEPAARLIKLNSDNEQTTAARLGIRGIPTMILYQRGRELGRISGAMSTQQIVAWTREQLGRVPQE